MRCIHLVGQWFGARWLGWCLCIYVSFGFYGLYYAFIIIISVIIIIIFIVIIIIVYCLYEFVRGHP